MDTKSCIICGIEKPITSFPLNPDGSVRRHACRKCYRKRIRVKLRHEFLTVFNFKCSCCGESDHRFLTLDHVQSDGFKERVKGTQPMQELLKAKKEGWPRDKYTCLCFNCNSGRARNGGVCPHKGISKEEDLVNIGKLIKLRRDKKNNPEYQMAAVARALNLPMEVVKEMIKKEKEKELK